MRDAGFTVVELMVSLVVVLLVAAGTAAVITYQSRLGVYRVKATNAQQAVETALVLIRNDMMQAGGTTSGVWWDAANKRLFIKYNGFLNFEAPSIPSQNCTLVRSVFCPSDCANNKCGAAWQIVDSDGSFTMDRFPPYVAYNLATQASAFFGAINVSSNDCQTLLGASVLKSVTEVAAPNPYHTLKFVPSPSFVAGSYASPPRICAPLRSKLPL